VNFLWEQVRLLKDGVHPWWCRLTSYDEPHTSGALLVLNKRPFIEVPVLYADNFVRNHGSPARPIESHYNTTGPSPLKHAVRVNPALATAMLAPKSGAGPS
jgi:hypothetical protein